MQKCKIIKGRILHLSNNCQYLGRGADILQSLDRGESWQPWVKLPVGLWLKVAMTVPFLCRLLRLGVHHLVFSGQTAVVIANKNAFIIEGERVLNLGPLHGSRPLALCAAGSTFYFGEYHSNTERSPVCVYGLDMPSRCWKPVWRFEGVRHIHGVFYDAYQEAIWVTTGDSDEESAIWRTDDHFQTLKKVAGGSQQFRVVHLLFEADYIYFGSDSPDERNYIYRMGRSNGLVEQLTGVRGSVFYGCKVGANLLFSTAVEPSKINNTREAEVWHSSDGRKWKKLQSFRKDFWPMKYFQYGQVLFPSVDGEVDGDMTYWTPFATFMHGKTIVHEIK